MKKAVLHFTLAFFVMLNVGFADEIKFSNGKITYTNVDDNSYSRGKIEYGDFKIEYDKIKFTRGAKDEYMFGISKAVKYIFPNADLLPGSKGTVVVENNSIQYIMLGYAKIGKDGDKNVPLVLESVLLKDNQVEKIQNGYFQLNDLVKFNVEQGAIKGITQDWGKSKFIYNKNYNNEFSFEFAPLNLKPTLKLNADLHISPEQFSAQGEYSVSIFKNRMNIIGLQLPDFLTENNPYTVRGKISYDKLHSVFHIQGEKEIESGNLVLNGSKSLMLTADLKNFGVKYKIKGKVNYNLDNVLKLMNSNNINLTQVSDYNQKMPVDERLFLWALQFYTTKEELQKMKNDGNNFDKEIELSIVVGYDPEYISKGKEYLDWNLMKIDIEVDGKEKNKQFEIKK